MKINNILNLIIVILIILGLAMIVLGFNSAAKTLYPPILTGIGFIAIALGFFALKKK